MFTSNAKFVFVATMMISFLVASCGAFVAPSSSRSTITTQTSFGTPLMGRKTPQLNMMLSGNEMDIISSSMWVAETEPWVQPLASVLDPFLNLFSFAMLCRVVISWYPTTKVNEFPFLVAVWPTEPLLRLIRGAVPPAFGVDITPIVWLGVFTFVHEIILGQQGLLTMKLKYGI